MVRVLDRLVLVRESLIFGTVGDWTQNAKLELENVTHRDILQTSLREMGDTGGDNVGDNVSDENLNPELSPVLKNYIVWNWFEDNCYQGRDHWTDVVRLGPSWDL